MGIEYLIGGFPSHNPIVQKKERHFEIEAGDEVHEIVSNAYYQWWEKNKEKEFNDFKDVDPLSDTEFRWY